MYVGGSEEMALGRAEWKKMICVVDAKNLG